MTGRTVTGDMSHNRDYLERTIATVRNHRDADNCWPQWANIFADEIERCWVALDQIATAPEDRVSSGFLIALAKDAVGWEAR